MARLDALLLRPVHRRGRDASEDTRSQHLAARNIFQEHSTRKQEHIGRVEAACRSDDDEAIRLTCPVARCLVRLQWIQN